MSDDSSSARLTTALRGWIAASPPGSKLPSTRALVAEHRVSPVTVQQALRSLTALGEVETRPGVGTFARVERATRAVDFSWQTAALGASGRRTPAAPTALQPSDGDAIGLHSGYPARELLPERLVRPALARASRSESLLGRPPIAGVIELRSWFAAELAALTPAGIGPVGARDVVITPGSQGALLTAFRALVGTGRPLVMESPTYWGAILAAEQAGVEVVPVPSGPSGPDPDVVRRVLAETGARAFYAQPTFASPTGAVWDADRAAAVLGAVRTAGAFLIEDDYARDFGIDAAPAPLAARDDDGHVVYIRSLSKSVAPAVRVAAVIARGPARDRILADTQADAMYVSGVLQAVALDVVTAPAWRTHLRRLAHSLGERRDLLLRSLREEAPSVAIDAVPRGGLALWARLPEEVDLGTVVDDCRRAGLVVGSGDEWFPAEPTGNHLRLAYAGPQPERFPEAARILEESITHSRARPE
ncbi:GntR family transcriptional regulator [Tsukamurella pulmonis]|uniref:DNA-binding transcriptional regulator, MocR family, contains an aminotransferase domain n=1 Tax=Tsukamurella pulmonis TaxID=47312 RepID=A0A1H1B6A0_9ACTN|nr:PLP-dependent aminotransferase family protein [Tsukamurella pulmonis]KXO94133.1 GntR family transcriptional regulator [Tsukamurella pulmonis]SDQ47459.1 DNA-binding transcriptional regulator, MocR family, contains an aminotransferase domain [Tsukamurella pulmonis]SUP25571.1 HTH-type transcriptional regulator norG [Tsukamurella pulmonis]